MGKDTALSVRQPWAWLLVNGYKDVENRNWSTPFRGKCLIHAGKTFDRDGYEWVMEKFGSQIDDLPTQEQFELGGIVGWVEIHDCVTDFESPWFFGKYGFVIKNAGKCKYKSLRGQLGFFEVEEIIKEAIPLHKIKVRLKVKPSTLVKNGQIAIVTVSVENLDGDPVEGVALSGEIDPATLGILSELPDTDADGHSYGKWFAGSKVGEGHLIINKVDSIKVKVKASIRLKPFISVEVDPPELVACSGTKANVEVTVTDYDGDPVQGIELSGWTLPATLGSVSDLSDSDGHSYGVWTAGKKAGKGLLIVSGGGAQGEAEIELKPPARDGGDGDCDGDDDDDDDDDDDNDILKKFRKMKKKDKKPGKKSLGSGG